MFVVQTSQAYTGYLADARQRGPGFHTTSV